MSLKRSKLDRHRRTLPRTKWRAAAAVLALALWLAPEGAGARSILFIGNSFTFGYLSDVRDYRPNTVSDLNGSGMGGVPALFKSFAVQAGLDYDVALETEPGVGVDWHVDHRLGVIGRRPWDVVVIQGYIALNPRRPADASAATSAVQQLAGFLRARNPAAELYLTATWSRADLTYAVKSPWYGKPIDAMARDLRAGYDQALKATPAVKSVVPVGEAWSRAMRAGVATANPYDAAGADKINLWASDDFHASTYGYYLEGLMLFGAITGRDPRSLGPSECTAFELGLPPVRVAALQQVAFEQLNFEGTVRASPRSSEVAAPTRCLH